MRAVVLATVLGLPVLGVGAENDLIVGVVKERVELRASARGDAHVVGALRSGQVVIAGRVPVDGFRFVSTGAGLHGYVPADAVELEKEPEPAAVEAVPAAAEEPRRAGRPDLRTRYATTPEQLLALVSDDIDVSERASRLVSRRGAASFIAWSSVVVGSALAFAGTYPSTAHPTRARNLLRAGFATISLGPLLGWSLTPERSDLAAAAAAWNARHPAERIVVP